jgi:hypothetical protein
MGYMGGKGLEDEKERERKCTLKRIGLEVHNGPPVMLRSFGGTDPTARPKIDIAAASGRLQLIGPSHKAHLNRKLSSEQSTDGRFVVAVTNRRP